MYCYIYFNNWLIVFLDDLDSREIDFDRSIPLMTPPKLQKTVTNYGMFSFLF